MIPTDEKSADRWLRNYPNAVIFILLAVMAIVVLAAMLFFYLKKPNPGPSRIPAKQHASSGVSRTVDWIYAGATRVKGYKALAAGGTGD